MALIANVLLLLYVLALIYIVAYCLLQFHLLYYYRKYHRLKRRNGHDEPLSLDDPPVVTIQLPIFNERYVAERLIDNIVEMDYPNDRLEIQVLDDSTDDTIELTRKKVEEYQQKGFNIKLYHRVNRQGYKAGALKDALPYAKGEFIAIFDADFLPNPDFLKVTLPHFNKEKVGVVQTRWEHINEDYSVLTRLQALQLNVHFRVEQKGREAGNCLLQFNGTAGVWRRKTIEDAGGWEADTLTEDLDLSYRAQLKGWKIIFLEEIGAPAELPAEINGLKSQQFRWMKGGAENARKLIPAVWQSSLTLRQKIHATGHLLASTVFLSIFLAAFFSVPLVFIIQQTAIDSSVFAISLTGLLSVVVVYYTANVQAELEKNQRLKGFFKFLFIFPIFLALSMGLSLHNSIAVIQGYLGKKSAFIRTPKFNIKGIKDSFRKGKYQIRKLPFSTFLEGFLAIYFLGGVIGAFYVENMAFFIFHLMLMIGFGSIFFFSVRHIKPR